MERFRPFRAVNDKEKTVSDSWQGAYSPLPVRHRLAQNSTLVDFIAIR